MDEKMENKKGIKKAAGAVGAWIKGHKVLAGIILAVLLALIGLFIFLHARSAGQKTETAEETVTVERRDLVQSLTLSGTVESGAAYSVSSTLTDVEVKQVNVKVGDTVQKGDIIAVLDDSDLRENVSSAEKNLSSAQKKNSQEISNAKRSLRNAEEDESVQTSRTEKDVKNATSQYNKAVKELNSLKSKLSSAKSDLSSAEVKLAQATADASGDHTKIDNLQKGIDDIASDIAENEKEIESGVKWETEKALRDENTTLWNTKRAKEEELENYKKDPGVARRLKAESDAQAACDSAQSSVSSLEEKIKTAQQKVSSLKETKEKAVQTNEDTERSTSRTVEEQQNALSSAYDNASDSLDAPRKELRKAQKDLDASQVVAEANGIVTAVNVKPGDKYKGDAIAVVQDDSSYRVSATADQYDISSLAVGQNADITITAAEMTDTEGKLIYVGSTPMVSETGSVGTSGSSSSAGSSGGSGANYRVETVILEPSKNMRIGMTAKVVVTVWKKNNVLAVPDEAIRTDENGNNYIVVVNDKGKKRNVEVHYGMKTDYYSEIIGDDVEEGMKVVLPSYGEDGADIGDDTEDVSEEVSEE